ncbi:MAG: hypothetical protein CM15mP1_3490 [Methanobacteriota archaeon]|nr:MAG: hypothetical protein CM15mP1_3490 [Euryarchaeota archaeon]
MIGSSTHVSDSQSNGRKVGFSIILLMFISVLNPIASADLSDFKQYGAELSSNPEDAPITYSYSPAIRAAFARVSDLSQYTESQINSAEEWVVVSQTKQGQATGLLPFSWYVEIDSDDAPFYFGELQSSGVIEVAYPLVEVQHYPRWTPNDPYFSDQWHLENTGQDNGVSGEDVNITGAWNNVRGTGVVIGVVDDGLEWDHDDLKTNYESTLDYDYCNYDGNPEPAGWDAHGTAAAGVAAATEITDWGQWSSPDASLQD